MKSLSLALVLILSLALTGCGWNPFHKMYSATAEIQIRPRGVVIVSVQNDPNANLPDLETQIATAIEIMFSPDILTPIIKDQKLDQIWAKRFQSNRDALSALEALDHLRKILKIKVVHQTNIIKVTAYSEAPEEAADIANALVDNYKAQRDQEETVRFSRIAK